MALRSWLFVPGDSERKLLKATETGADVILLDLEDAVAPSAKETARRLSHDWLEAHRRQIVEHRRQRRWVRINAMDTPLWRDDLLAVMGAAPDGIMVPKVAGPLQLQQLAAELYELEQRHGIATGNTRLLPIVSETARSALAILSYLDASLPRLAGLTWGAEDLSAEIGARRKYAADGTWTDTFRMIRATVLLTAQARGILAIDTLHTDFRDDQGLTRFAHDAAADGFAGMLAIHPAQVPVINAAFTPSEAELEEARAIVAAFAANPHVGTLALHGRMLDQPHLRQAQRLLEDPI